MRDRMQLDASAMAEFVETIQHFPLEREVTHCDTKFAVSPFDFYATCPQCGTRIKVRGFSAAPEIEDLFDAVFTWMSRPAAAELARRRLAEIEQDSDN